jgi:sugar (glycoside-pentoside-hexuronide) transporter
MNTAVSRTLVATYSLPMIGANFALVLVVVYFPKYSIDTLLIAPATVGLVFGLARIWDAISDPFAGYLSDRTKTRMGRRRPWIAASILPLALFTWMCWHPPASLEGGVLVAWMTISILGFNTAITVFFVPHQALGAELSDETHARTRLFGVRQLAATVGAALAMVGGVGWINAADDPRAAASLVALITIAVFVSTAAVAAVRLREPVGHRDRGGTSPYASFGDVLRNPHARVLFGVIFVDNLGSGAVMVAMAFFVDYVIGTPKGIGLVFAFYTGTQLLTIYAWVRLSRTIGKKRTWYTGIGVQTMGYLCIFFLVGEGSLWTMCALICLTAAGSVCGSVLGSAILADVIDWDELATSERKEGTYYSGYMLLTKGSSGVMAMVAGWALSAVGFAPNQVQDAETQLVIRALITVVPAVCILGGALLLTRFRLTEDEHARIRGELDSRALSKGLG